MSDDAPAIDVPPEVDAVVRRWSPRAQEIFSELMEDAPTELQRELVQRAVLAGHAANEVHAFADELRGLTDEACFDACTLDDAAAAGLSVVQRLKAEVDPLYAFTVRGGTLTPNDGDAPMATSSMPVLKREAMDAPEDRALAADPVRRAKEQRRGFDSGAFRALKPGSRPSLPPASSSSMATLKPVGSVPNSASMASLKPVGSTAPNSASMATLKPVGSTSASTPAYKPGSVPPASASSMPTLKPGGAKVFEDVLTEATRALGVTWREYEVDTADLSLEQAMLLIASSLGRGVPVPAVFGNANGKPLKFVVILQLSVSGSTRALQLFEPTSQELVWANERDLLTRGELPFDNKSLRRLVRIATPR